MTATAKKTAPQENVSNALATLGKADAQVSLGVKDIQRARSFYTDILGFKLVEDMGEVLTYQSGETNFLVYTSEFAGTNKATAATWLLKNGEAVRAVAAALKDKGVKSEDYKMDGIKKDGDVYVSDDESMTMFWFKDPDGNILAVVGE